MKRIGIVRPILQLHLQEIILKRLEDRITARESLGSRLFVRHTSILRKKGK